MKSLVVVESPAKAKTINKYLGKDYKVLASIGHIRELPSKDGSVDTTTFDLKYEISKKSNKVVKELCDTMKQCDRLILATDPDREGEAIAWHVYEVLKQKKALTKDTPIERVVFNAITKHTVEEAIKNPRQIDNDLVSAQQARRALDYLFGFSISPVLWRKLPGSRSAGRVQSPALGLICDRYEEILNFKSVEYWSVDVLLKTQSNKELLARLTKFNGKKIDKLTIKNKEQVEEIKKILSNRKDFTVASIEAKETKRFPFAPFTTSTLQQEASKKLGFSTKKTMSVAQKLYEGIDTGDGTHGLITYMRTDGVYTAPEAIQQAREVIKDRYGVKYLPKNAINYENKVKNAQEAHEAIRPTNITIIPENIKKYLTAEEFKLYELIWKRLIASQMSYAILDQVMVEIKTGEDILKATGSTIKFDGFLTLYNETEEDNSEEQENKIPALKNGEQLTFQKIIDKQHFTEPPAKYSEASLVKKMEEIGIGRPSTYANIISVLLDRGYVRLEKKRFIPENRGIVVNTFLKLFFSNYVKYDYTAQLENDLDIISNGKKDWKVFLGEFWKNLDKNVKEVLDIKTSNVIEEINKVLGSLIFGYDDKGKLKNKCPDCETGILNIKTGKFGVFIACSNYPECKHTEQLVEMIKDDNSVNGETGENANKQDNKFENKELGKLDGKNIYLKKGPYGFYIQQGEDSEKPKPKRVSLAKGINIETFDFEKAKNLLALPRLIGKHPADNSEIKANIGPYGPYLMWNKKFFSVKNDDILTIDLNRAVEIIENSGKNKNTKKEK